MALLAAPNLASAGDWSQYRGPDRAGAVGAAGLLESWTADRPREVWRRPIGGGYSSVSVAGGRVFTMSTRGDEDTVLCLDEASGETLWELGVGGSETEKFPEGGPRSTPTVDGDRLYVVSSGARMLALSIEDGAIAWEKDLTQWGKPPRFGYASSPLVDGDVVIVEVGEPDKAPGVVALDKATGELRWSALEGPAGYSSPLVAEIGGVRQYVFSRGGEAVGLSTSGEVLWRWEGERRAAIPMPIFVAPDRVFIATADDHFGGVMLRISAGDEGFQAEEVWSERLMRNHFNSSVVVAGHVYGFDNATLRCLDAATGEQRWAKRGFGKGSLVAAGDRLFVLGDDGALALVRATGEGYVESGRVQAMEGRAWTAPSIANGRIYVRDSDEIACYDVSAESGAVGESDAL